jgi:hypothetical protein
MTRNINRDVCGLGERVQSKNNGCSAGLQSFVFHDAGVAMWVDPNKIRFLNTQFKDRSCLIDPLRIEARRMSVIISSLLEIRSEALPY